MNCFTRQDHLFFYFVHIQIVFLESKMEIFQNKTFDSVRDLEQTSFLMRSCFSRIKVRITLAAAENILDTGHKAIVYSC